MSVRSFSLLLVSVLTACQVVAGLTDRRDASSDSCAHDSECAPDMVCADGTCVGSTPDDGGSAGSGDQGGANASDPGGSAGASSMAAGGTEKNGGSSGTSTAGSGGGTGAGGNGASTAGSGGGLAGSGGVHPGKGASGRAVCTGQSGFVDPTTGMGEVKEVTAPQGSFFAFIEGPVWVATTKQLLFSDNAGSPERIWSFDPASMAVKKALEDSGSNGLAVDSNDQIVVADQKDGAIYRWNSATAMKVGSTFAAGAFKPNDVVVRSDGGIYITDPDSGLYYIAPGSSEAKQASTKVERPNGLVLTLDEKALIVGDVNNQSLSQFELDAGGGVIDATTPFGKTMGATADGMCEDCAGNVYVSTATGVEIFDPTGKRLGVVPTGESSNCTFGGADRKTLFVASRAILKVVAMANPGLPD